MLFILENTNALDRNVLDCGFIDPFQIKTPYTAYSAIEG